jgi:hypothetical protein
MAAARLLGNKYNPDDEEGLQRELEHGFSRMLMIRLEVEHLTGKSSPELIRERRQE